MTISEATLSQNADVMDQTHTRVPPKFSLIDHAVTLPLMFRTGPNAVMEYAFKRHGEIAMMNFGGFKMAIVSHPDYVRHVLVSAKDNYCKGRLIRQLGTVIEGGLFISEGEFWQSQRRLMQPEFTKKSVNTYVNEFAEIGAAMADEWAKKYADKPMDISAEMRYAAMRIICKSVLNYQMADDEDELSKAIDEVLRHITEEALGVFPLLNKLQIGKQLRFKKKLKQIDDVIYEILGKRGDGNSTGDLVARLVAAIDPLTGRKMTAQQLRDEVLTIYIAGHETTALGLTWAWYLLSQYPGAEAALHAELDSVLGSRLPTIEDLPNLPYTLAVFKEALRLYPPAWMVPREAVKDDVIGNYKIKAGTTIGVAIYVTQRRPDFWPKPNAFMPERFLPENEKAHNNYAYIPFGAGPRTCIGNHFALAEATVLLAVLAQRYKARLEPGQSVRPRVLTTLRPARPVMMRLVPRQESVTKITARSKANKKSTTN